MVKYLLVGLALLGAAADVGAGAWTLQSGQLWGKLTYFQQQTQEWYVGKGRFGAPGTRARYDFDGQYESRAVFFESMYGVTDRLDLGLQVPYFDQSFANAAFAEPRTDTGLSDIRALAKFRLLAQPLVLALKAGVKVPTGEFKNEDGLIPVGEGQWDFDFVGQVGRSFWPLPLYGNIDLGYRVRTRNEQIDRDPGDEWFLNAEMGYQLLRQLMLLGKCEVLRSDPAIDFFGDFEIETGIKRITYLTPALLYAIGQRTTIEAAVRFSLNGRNFPAGRQFVLGVATTLGKDGS
ncbi:MAG: transporter [Gemmatimonadetes bacterium]|nr:transporter [Gemmatimonadota bacterium]